MSEAERLSFPMHAELKAMIRKEVENRNREAGYIITDMSKVVREILHKYFAEHPPK